MSTRRLAASNTNSLESITQGPAIKASGWPSPTTTGVLPPLTVNRRLGRSTGSMRFLSLFMPISYNNGLGIRPVGRKKVRPSVTQALGRVDPDFALGDTEF